MAQIKPKTLEEQKKIAWEKFLAKQISESDYHMWIKVYTEQWKFNSPKNYHQGGTITGKKKIVLFAPIDCSHDYLYKIMHNHLGVDVCTKCGNIKRQISDTEKMSDTEIRHFNAE